MIAWKSQKGKMMGIAKVRDLRGAKKKELWIDRLMVSYDICMALKYLHDNNIVYRDLKPDNIGFDVRGDVKIFDFGLAKEMRMEDLVSDDLYDMSGNTGSLRYMAPEVALRRPYNHTVDVFSFGILLWQICSLDQPFEKYDVAKHSELVVHGGDRPKLDAKNWSVELCTLLSQCWSVNIRERPNFEDVASVLRHEFNPFLSEREKMGLDESNKTAKSMEAAA
jgi:serine/threonine protein kinase